ncbi:hypothetical protein ACEZ3G_11785 [Maribacter algicola]|uniref:Uncharacterized protein n=1 Tax=Meishania litoralis TaxID=3434685 RepID=A0ACC7LK99_9FLAO
MPFTPDNFRNALFKGGSKEFQLLGLDAFVNALEKDFFSSIYLTKRLNEKNECLLTLELTCNLSLAGLLFHFKKDEWGAFHSKGYSLTRHLKILESKNPFFIDVDEFSIFLKDTAIIINRIHSRSITVELQNIVSEIGRHYVYMTKELGEMPFEIYIPVFDSDEEELHIDSLLDGPVFIERDKKEYYRYWGLYFESEKNPLIYELEKRALLPGSLFIFP